MALTPKTRPNVTVDEIRHSEKRPNIPPAAIASDGTVPLMAPVEIDVSPRQSPTLRFDDNDELQMLLEKAARSGLSKDEGEKLAALVAVPQPYLSWAKKAEKSRVEIEPVALHIHERLSTQAILSCSKKESPQKSLFAEDEWDYDKDLEFYQHDMEWANRLILGDSLSVMASLSRREGLAGQVQTVYIDPPYGIKFASNFQPKIGQRDVKDKDDDLTREPETVRAYRDTWNLGVHSYLTYLRDRLVLAKELLTDSGSIFVQISDENLHRVRCVMDEVFGAENFVTQITFIKTTSATSEILASTSDYLIWFSKDRKKLKYNQLYTPKSFGEEGASAYNRLILVNGEKRSMTAKEKGDLSLLPIGTKIYRIDNLTSQRPPGDFPIQWNGNIFRPRKGYWKTGEKGMELLKKSERLEATDGGIYYVRYIEDFPVFPITNLWDDTSIAGFASDKKYVVQTSTKVIERCILMTSDPGDLVFDPTCGSGTTAYVAETWGRRWITCDTSRVALAIARQWLLTAKFNSYEFDDPAKGVRGNFKYQEVPHITLKSIAQNQNLDPIFEKYAPDLELSLEKCNIELREVSPQVRRELKTKLASIRKPTEADRRRLDLPERFEHWTVPFEPDEDYPSNLASQIQVYRRFWREKMDAVNAAIAQNADQETLYDKPIVKKNAVRVSGPFTVEAVQPPEMSLSAPEVLHDEIQDELPSFSVQEVVPKPAFESQNAASYIENLISLLKADGVTFLGNNKITFESVEAHQFGSVPAHAVGMWKGDDGQDKRAIISFGPQYGPIGARQVDEVGRIAYRRGFDSAIFAGFAFDDAASSRIEKGSAIPFHLAHIRPDVNPASDGLYKTTPNSQLFSVFGSPRINVEKIGEEYSVEMQGMDIYDPTKDEIVPTGAGKVAAWFLDCDYDGRTFCISQAFFPDQNAWDKIGKALGNAIDVSAFAGKVSVPFKAGENRRIAVKVIDPRGNEVMSVEELN